MNKNQENPEDTEKKQKRGFQISNFKFKNFLLCVLCLPLCPLCSLNFLVFLSDSHHGVGPGETAAEGDEDDGVAGGQQSGSVGFVQGDGDRGGGSVSVAVDIHERLIGRQAELFHGRVDDALVHLVRDDQLDLVLG